MWSIIGASYLEKNMALRLIECVLPADSAQRVIGDIDLSTVVGAWSIEQKDESCLIRILASTDRTEELVERLEDEFSLEGNSRIFLSDILATVPKMEEDDDEQQEDPPARVAAIELTSTLRDSIELDANFFAMVFLSTIVASVGLINNDTAVVIGAMVIAPLLAPNISLALGTTLGDLDLLRKSSLAALLAFLAAALFSFVVGFLVPFDTTVATLDARAHIGAGDVALALAAGSAGALAFTAGMSEGIVGVMVAVALLPALATAGLLAGAGEWAMAGRAALLFSSNVIGVNLAAIATFVAKGLRPNFVWEEEQKRAKRGLIVGIAIWTTLLAVVSSLAYWVSL